jgi:hypothetical protein
VQDLAREKKAKQLSEYTERITAKPDSGDSFTKKSIFRVLNNVQVSLKHDPHTTLTLPAGDHCPAAHTR